jgi:23S rRNA (uracil1939-C5)-methyltransferase
LLIKEDVLADQLARIGGFENVDVQPVIPSPEQWGYNHEMTLIAGENGALGFTSTDGTSIINMEECHILHPDLLALYESLDLEFDGLRRLKLQIGTDGHHMLILTMAGDQAPELEIDLPTSVNMLLEDNEPVNLIGESNSRFTVEQRTFRVTAGSYFRPNVAQLSNLVTVVRDALDLIGGESVLDLYGGVGLYSAFIADRVSLVTLVESYPPAATDADENLADFENIDLIEGTVEDFLLGLEEAYDAAIIDPPGDGLSLEALDGLVEAKIPRLVYVSSDPATLARDAKRLAVHGYQLLSVQPIDLAPQTYFIDTVAVLERAL